MNQKPNMKRAVAIHAAIASNVMAAMAHVRKEPYHFNYTLCTGCAVCFEQCPCHAIDMKVEIPFSDMESIPVKEEVEEF